MPLRVRRLFAPLSTPGLLVGTVFFALSLAPSLLPRPWVFQGVVSGVSLSLGYLLGCGARWIWEFLELPLPSERVARYLLRGAVAVSAAVAVFFLWNAGAWQAALRELMGVEPEGGIRPFAVGSFTLTLFGVLLFLGRLFLETTHSLGLRLRRETPPRVAALLSVALAVSLFWTLTEGVVYSSALRLADRTYEELDRFVTDDLTPPRFAGRSGSEDSRVAWDLLGRQGRAFVTGGPDAAEISTLTGEPAREPLRLYVGLRAAETPEERARLALEELERSGAFSRAVLVLVTPTGTGWVDPGAITPVEYLTHGDVATVAVQYSYLSSPLALLAEPAYGAETARALFLEVYRYWTGLPSGERPALYLQGVSLGALNSTLSFDFQDILADPFQGALWSGPPFRTEAWARATRDRDPGSPYWLPRYRDGRVVRFMNQDGGLDASDDPWGPFRIVYLQYAGDPITFFSLDSFFREPEWMEEPRGPDVLPAFRWYPVITMLQLAADMLVGGAPPGFGHTFSARHYLEAWSALLEPEGWSPEALEALRERMGEMDRELAGG